ncbi:MAG: alpha/beta fold hydrolase [Pseudomonadota bacterium]
MKKYTTFPRMTGPVLLAFFLTACAERGELSYAPTVEGATLQTVWVANFRSDVQADSKSAPPRPKAPVYEAIDVSIPPTHEVGNIEWPEGIPNAKTDFVSVENRAIDGQSGFARQVARADLSGRNETLLFVHGYNTRHAEAVYQVAQFAHDFDVPTPAVLFSWPSAGVTAGYVYDRDSALIARDHLEDLMIQLSKGNRKIILVGHSMGSYLIMETLRQAALKRSFNAAAEIDALVLMAPDIDGELFRSQVDELDQLPDPFILMVAKQDRALRISSLLTGRRPRLGAQTDRSVVGDLPISVVDVSDFSDGNNFDHKIVTTSPEAIALIRRLSQEAPPGEADVGDLTILSDLEQ